MPQEIAQVLIQKKDIIPGYQVILMAREYVSREQRGSDSFAARLQARTVNLSPHAFFAVPARRRGIYGLCGCL